MVSFSNCSIKVALAKFMIESSNHIYSPYVFTIGQFIGEIPYNIMWTFVLSFDGALSWVMSAHFANSDHRSIQWGIGMVVLEPIIQVFSFSSPFPCSYLEYLVVKWLLLWLPAHRSAFSSLCVIHKLTKQHRLLFCLTLSLFWFLLLSVV